MNQAAPQVEVIGIHPVEVDDAVIRSVLEMKYDDPDLGADSEEYRAVAEELRGAALIEVRLAGAPHGFDVGLFGQYDNADDDCRQAPYLDEFLSDDGLEIVRSTPERPASRLAFYLHFVDFNAPLCTPFGRVVLPRPTPIPARLKGLIPYAPVD